MKRKKIIWITAALAAVALTAAFFWGGAPRTSQSAGLPGSASPEASAAPSSDAGTPNPEAVNSASPTASSEIAPSPQATLAPQSSQDPQATLAPQPSQDPQATSAPRPSQGSQDSQSSQSSQDSQAAGETKPPEPAGNGEQNSSNGQTSEPSAPPSPVEPEDAEIGETEYTCTLSVRCDTILNNMDKLDAAKKDLVPSDGVIFSETQVTFYEGESVFNVLQRELKKAKVHLEFVNTPLYNSAYIEGIGNLYEFDCGDLSGWIYKVNGWAPNYGCSRYSLQDGDVIEWVYTCDLGRDVGAEFVEQGDAE